VTDTTDYLSLQVRKTETLDGLEKRRASASWVGSPPSLRRPSANEIPFRTRLRSLGCGARAAEPLPAKVFSSSA
jgi:hypothetical protein